MLTIFANMRINDEDGLQHLKDSFYSFDTVSDDWLINIRGTLRMKAVDFLAKELGSKMKLFELLDDSRGWIVNALEMLPYAKHDYLFLWNEDHLNTTSQDEIVKLVKEMGDHGADYCLYSWWMSGKAREAFDVLPVRKGEFIDTVLLTKERWMQVRANGYPYYLLSLCGIYRKAFFKHLLLKDRRKLPMCYTKGLYRAMTLMNRLGLKFQQKKYFHLVNKLLFHKLRRFTKEAPFDLEKGPDRTDILPFMIALPKKELFACIDDDLDTPGYQLIKRGKYPTSFSLKADKMDEVDKEAMESDEHHEIFKIFLPKTNKYRRAYHEDAVRVAHLLKENIVVRQGKIMVEMGGLQNTLSINEKVLVYPHIGYTVTALEDAQFSIVSPSLKDLAIHYVGVQSIQK